jgi:ubiquinol-cytochrome c reductase cytochrome c1 subunit
MTKPMMTSPLKSLLARGALALAAAFALAGGALAAGGAGLQNANISLADRASLQRGAALFFNYCSGCHALDYVRYSRIGEDLGIDTRDVEQHLIFTGAKVGERATNNMSVEDGTAWFGKAPPDLSLEARAKGADWIYTYLKSFYLDPTRPLGWNNTVFPNVSMPNALWDLQGLQVAVTSPGQGEGAEPVIHGLEIREPGRQNEREFDRTVRDITAFLEYVGEPAALKRTSMGVWVLLYLVIFTFIAYLLNREFWKDVK